MNALNNILRTYEKSKDVTKSNENQFHANYLLDNFRSHPKRSADESIAFGGGVGDLSGDAEIGELHLTSFADQHVRSLGTRFLGATMAEDLTFIKHNLNPYLYITVERVLSVKIFKAL